MNIKELIKESIYKEGKPSSSRILALNMQMIIFLFGVIAILIEVVNSIVQWNQGNVHIIPWEHITILGMWLAHQLTLLGIYKANESKVNKIIENKEITNEKV